MVHIAVVVYFVLRRGVRTFALHLASPAIGFVVIAFVLANSDVHAKLGGTAWLAVGVIMAGLRVAGRSTELQLEGWSRRMDARSFGESRLCGEAARLPSHSPTTFPRPPRE